jgi:hypothetical protein
VRAWRVGDHQVESLDYRAGKQGQDVAHVVVQVVAVLGWQEVAGNGVMAQRPEGPPDGPRELAGDQDPHFSDALLSA